MPTHAPLTFQQQWLLSLTRDNERWQCAAAYAFRLRGELSLSLLQRCVQAVIRRHASLRTRIAVSDAGFWQEIAESLPFTLTSEPVPGDSEMQREAKAKRIVGELCDLKMDITAGPLWNARLLRLDAREHWLILAMHRLIGDCASIDQVYQEIRALYGAWEQGLPSPLGEPRQYRDYALEQRRSAVEWANRHEQWWRQHLSGATCLRWSQGPPKAAGSNETLGKVQCSFGEELSAHLREFARKSRTLAATLMMALYASVLWNWTRQEDFVLPFNIAGRQSEHKSVIGYFSYVLYLRIRITGDEAFEQVLGRVGNEFFSTLSHQDFGRVVAEQSTLLAGTLFQWITWHPDDVPTAPRTAVGGVPQSMLTPAIERVSVRDFGEGLTLVPPGMTALEVTFFDTPQGLLASGSYRTECFNAPTMERLMTDLRAAAELFVHNPKARIAPLSTERH